MIALSVGACYGIVRVPGQRRNDSRHFAVGGSCVKRDDGASTAGQSRPTYHIDRATGGSRLPTGQHIGVYLPKEINLQGRINRHEIVNLTYYADIVGVAHRAEPEFGPDTCPFDQRFAAQRAPGDDLAFVHVLFLAGDVASFRQCHHAIGDHARLNPEIVLVGERAKDCIGNCTDPDLNAVTVSNQFGDVACDLPRCRIDFSGRENRNRELTGDG